MIWSQKLFHLIDASFAVDSAFKETIDVKENAELFTPMLRTLMSRAKFTELTSLEKSVEI